MIIFVTHMKCFERDMRKESLITRFARPVFESTYLKIGFLEIARLALLLRAATAAAI